MLSAIFTDVITIKKEVTFLDLMQPKN